MRARFGLCIAVLVCLSSAACSSRRATGGRLDRTVITRDQMLQAKYISVYDAVAGLRSLWLRPRGPDSFVLPSTIWVYVDGAKVGDIEVLRNMQTRLVNTVRFYDGPSATSRWGVDHAAGVIHVSTWSEGAPGMFTPDSTRRRPPDSTGVRRDTVSIR